MLHDLQMHHTAAVDDFRMGRCNEGQFRRQLERLGYTPTACDAEVAANVTTWPRVMSKIGNYSRSVVK